MTSQGVIVKPKQMSSHLLVISCCQVQTCTSATAKHRHLPIIQVEHDARGFSCLRMRLTTVMTHPSAVSKVRLHRRTASV